MRPDDTKRLYDARYAAAYDEKFLNSAFNAPNVASELELLGELLNAEPEWLDVACGTGLLWSFVEEGGAKVHAQMVAPQLEWLIERFQARFRKVEVVHYTHKADGVHGRPANIAREKR